MGGRLSDNHYKTVCAEAEKLPEADQNLYRYNCINAPGVRAVSRLIGDLKETNAILDAIKVNRDTAMVTPFFYAIPTMAWMLLDRTHTKVQSKIRVDYAFRATFVFLAQDDTQYGKNRGWEHQGLQVVMVGSGIHDSNNTAVAAQLNHDAVDAMALCDTNSQFCLVHFTVEEHAEKAFDMLVNQTEDQDVSVGDTVTLVLPIMAKVIVDVWMPKAQNQ